MLSFYVKKTTTPFVFLFAAAIFFIGCKKENIAAMQERQPVDVAPTDYSEIIINGKTYPTVKIGGLTWTASNYDATGGIVYDANNSKPAYGKYYTMAEARAVDLPTRWRLPTDDDYYALLSSQQIILEAGKVTNPESIKRLLSLTDWRNITGNNKSGFNAQPAGYVIDAKPGAVGLLAEFWTADNKTFSIQEGANQGTLKLLFYGADYSNTNKFTIRFVKNN